MSKRILPKSNGKYEDKRKTDETKESLMPLAQQPKSKQKGLKVLSDEIHSQKKFGSILHE